MQKNQNWQEAKNILCIRLDNMGDIIMTIPAIRALKENKSNPKITLLTSSVGAHIVSCIPEINDCITFDPPWMKNDKGNSSYKISDLIEKLRARRFDAAVLFTVYSQSPFPAAMICYEADIPLIAGYSRENPYYLMSNWIPDPEPLLEIKHEVIRQLELVNTIGFSTQNTSLSLSENKSAEENINKLLLRHGIKENQKFLLLNPGVSEERRKFPTDILAEAANLCKSLNLPILITGNAQESSLAKKIVSQTHGYAIDITGTMQVKELVCLIKKASVLISNNTGPVHIASAMGTPVVVLYALTNPQHIPWNVSHIVLPFEVPKEKRSKNIIIEFAHKISFRNTPADISPNDIYHAVKSLLEKNHDSSEQAQVLSV